jgi:hypothetical protein
VKGDAGLIAVKAPAPVESGGGGSDVEGISSLPGAVNRILSDLPRLIGMNRILSDLSGSG